MNQILSRRVVIDRDRTIRDLWGRVLDFLGLRNLPALIALRRARFVTDVVLLVEVPEGREDAFRRIHDKRGMVTVVYRKAADKPK